VYPISEVVSRLADGPGETWTFDGNASARLEEWK